MKFENTKTVLKNTDYPILETIKNEYPEMKIMMSKDCPVR